MPKVKTRLEVKNETGSDTAVLYLYGVIRKQYWWDEEDICISANAVLKKLQALSGKNIDVHINSPGGDFFESIAICNLFEQHNGTIHMYLDSLAGSGASLLITAGDKIFMYPNSMQMIHKAWCYAEGNADELRKTADDLDKMDAAVKASYMKNFVGTEEELTKLMAEETFLTAAECLAFGLCDEIIEPAPKEEPPQVSVRQSLFAKYGKDISLETPAGQKPALFNAFVKK